MPDAPSSFVDKLSGEITDALVARKIAMNLRGEDMFPRHIREVVCGVLISRSAKLEPDRKVKSSAATEEDWLKVLEKEPALAGVSVREELAHAQFWCKNNNRVCTRKFFVNWLNKADRKISHGGGKETRVSRDPYNEPDKWRTDEVRQRIARYSLMSPETWVNVCARKWMDLSPDLRADIIRSMI